MSFSLDKSIETKLRALPGNNVSYSLSIIVYYSEIVLLNRFVSIVILNNLNGLLYHMASLCVWSVLVNIEHWEFISVLCVQVIIIR